MPAMLLALSANLTSATVISLFQDSGDLDNFQLKTNATDADTVEVASTFLDGTAIRQFDTNAGGRTTLRYLGDSAFNEGIQVSFDVVDFSTGTNLNAFRIGPDNANLSGGVNISLGVSMRADGAILADSALDGSPSVITWENAFTPQERFNLSIVYNTTADNLDLSSTGGPILTTNSWAIFVNGSLLNNGEVLSSNLATRNLNVSGAQDMWFLTGSSNAQAGLDIQYDNIMIATGTDISVVPEPSTYALISGLGIFLIASIRRIRARQMRA